MAKVLATVKAILTRVVFACHGGVAIWQVVVFKHNLFFWYLTTPILILFFEALFTLTIKESQEWKWFCPSVFLYLSSVVPAIWLLELDKVDRRLTRSHGLPHEVTRDLARDVTNQSSINIQDLDKLFGVQLRLPAVELTADTWVTLVEQFLMLILIIGRWMLPKGDLTRDELSQLLLVYIGTAADIIEFFDSFKDETIAKEPVLVLLTLGIWSWSLLQFTVVLTATKSRKSRLTTTQRKKKVVKKSGGRCARCCTIDVWGIGLNIALQDLPFFVFRLLLIVHYRIITYMNVFFTCKNTLVIVLQLYRLYVLQAEARSRKKNRQRQKTPGPVIPAISGALVYPSPQERRPVALSGGESSSHDEETLVLQELSVRPKQRKPGRERGYRQDTGYSTASSSHASLPQAKVKADARPRSRVTKPSTRVESRSSTEQSRSRDRDRRRARSIDRSQDLDRSLDRSSDLGSDATLSRENRRPRRETPDEPDRNKRRERERDLERGRYSEERDTDTSLEREERRVRERAMKRDRHRRRGDSDEAV